MGATNSIATYVVYLGLLQLVGYAIAYSVAFALGIAFSYAANSLFVFRAPMSVKSAAGFPVVYVFQYVAGLALIAIQVDLLSIPAWLAPWAATAILLPATFVLVRRVLKPKA